VQGVAVKALADRDAAARCNEPERTGGRRICRKIRRPVFFLRVASWRRASRASASYDAHGSGCLSRPVPERDPVRTAAVPVASGLTRSSGSWRHQPAHGSFYMIGAYMAFAIGPWVEQSIGGGFFVTLVVVVLLAVLLGYVLEWVFFSYLLNASICSRC